MLNSHWANPSSKSLWQSTWFLSIKGPVIGTRRLSPCLKLHEKCIWSRFCFATSKGGTVSTKLRVSNNPRVSLLYPSEDAVCFHFANHRYSLVFRLMIPLLSTCRTPKSCSVTVAGFSPPRLNSGMDPSNIRSLHGRGWLVRGFLSSSFSSNCADFGIQRWCKFSLHSASMSPLS